MLGLKFAYATNGHDLIEFDYFTGLETTCTEYPTPAALWQRYQQASGITDQSTVDQLLTPYNHLAGKGERYYQHIAIQRAVEAILKGQPRILITMATGTGKTVVAFQICWKLWAARWNRTGEHRRPKILYLADRNILVDQPKDGIFAAFGDARYKIESGEVVKSREMYFILDYTGSATRLFADPAFDGDPARLTEEELKDTGETTIIREAITGEAVYEDTPLYIKEPPSEQRRKYYFDGGQVEIAAHLVYDLDPDGKQLRVARYTDYAAEKIRTICPTAKELRERWADPERRSEIIQQLEERGISFTELAETVRQPEADPFDLLCHLAFNAPLRTRRERAQQLRSERQDFFDIETILILHTWERTRSYGENISANTVRTC